LDLQVRQGEFISLLGPSGCGKTTTLHMIAGFLEPDRGDIVLDGQSLRDVPSHRRGTAMVFQNYALFPHLSVFDNVAFGLKMARTPSREVARRVSGALELVRLHGLNRRYPRELSGGQQQRVALARALVLEPRLLLLDEPLSNLDAALRRTLRQDFIEIHRLTGMTTILVTHDLEEAFVTSDRIAVLGEGRLQQFDTPQKIYTHPRTRFVADFLGHENVFEGRVSEDATGPWLRTGNGLSIALPPSRQDLADHPPGAHARYALPARQVRLLQGPNPGSGGTGRQFSAQLQALSYLGATVTFVVDVQGVTLQGEQNAGLWTQGLTPGSPVQVQWDTDALIELPLV